MKRSTAAVLAVLLAAGLTVTSASAQTAEEAYYAARDVAIARVKALNHPVGPTDPTPQEAVDEDNRALAALERQLRAIVGPVAINGMTGTGTINLDTLNDGDEGFGLLDGMVYGGPDGKTRVIVTTESLFKHWLHEHKDWWGKTGYVPQDMSAAVKENDFYTQAVLTVAAILHYADLPLRKPASTAFAYAVLAARTQDRAPPKAAEIFVAMAQGGQVFVANTTEFAPVGPIAACDAIRADYDKRAEEAAQQPDADGKTAGDRAGELMAKADSEFLRCFGERAPQQSGFPAALQAAQALFDLLPLR